MRGRARASPKWRATDARYCAKCAETVGFDVPVVYDVAMAQSPEQQTSAARFATTHWSVVLAASQGAASGSREALEKLCGTYWQPVYAYLRRKGYGTSEAQDLTQGFFARFLEKNYLENVAPEKGKFRSYLLGAVKHFVSNERDRAQAKKRGGGRRFIPLDVAGAESRCGIEPSDELTPEKIFDKCWALALLDHVLSRLEEEAVRAGTGKSFDHLKVFLTGEKGAPSYRETAKELNMTEGAVKVAVHRMRRRYRDILKEEVVGTVAGPEEAEDEIRYLLSAVSN